ncbi:MAG: ATP-binding protein [Bacteroidales bacterium]|nr:ATP-binding protein [Bacteroidales bacterium]
MEKRKKQYAYSGDLVLSQAACLNRIYSKVNEMGLSPECLGELREDIAFVRKHYNIDGQSAVLLAGILEKSGGRDAMRDEDLAEYLGCSNIEFISHHDRLREMERLGIIEVADSMRGQRYRATPEAMKAVETNSTFVPIKRTGLSPTELFAHMARYLQLYKSGRIDDDRLVEEMDGLVRGNPELEFCRKTLDSCLFNDCGATERRMFYYLCSKYASEGRAASAVEILMRFADCMTDDFDRMQANIASGSLPIQRGGLLCFDNDEGFEDPEVLSLTDEVKNDFFCEVHIPEPKEPKYRDLVRNATIKAKELFFNEEEGAELDRLRDLLGVENFAKVQERLEECGMRKGFNIIFYGAPGTGKTASAFELARCCGRDVFHVDMARLKSKWVGDSEKSVRSLFRIYRSLCGPGKKAPILLFNEADAIFSRRLENVEGSADQSNNAIQNIILEEMESLGGILIATTNMLSNLDPAFERRFIYKLEFKMPGLDARARIWQSMIKGLSAEDARTLAYGYNFSGGNIENIARKSLVDYVLTGSSPTLAALQGACDVELLDKRAGGKIGF